MKEPILINSKANSIYIYIYRSIEILHAVRYISIDVPVHARTVTRAYIYVCRACSTCHTRGTFACVHAH